MPVRIAPALVTMLLLGLGLPAAGCGSGSNECAMTETAACVCDDGRKGLATCAADGSGFGACDCASACTEVERSCAVVSAPDHLGMVLTTDSCGNVAPLSFCDCGCAAVGRECANEDIRFADPGDPACVPDDGCAEVTYLACIQEPGEFRSGFYLTNKCDHEIQCVMIATFGVFHDGAPAMDMYTAIEDPQRILPGTEINSSMRSTTIEECLALGTVVGTVGYACYTGTSPDSCAAAAQSTRTCASP